MKDTIEKQAAALTQKAAGILEKGFAAMGGRAGKEFAASFLKAAGGAGKDLSGVLEKSVSGMGKAAAESVEKSVSAASTKAADTMQRALDGGYNKALEKAKSRVAALEEKFDSIGTKMDAMRVNATRMFAGTKDPTGSALGSLGNNKEFQSLEKQQSAVLEKLRAAEENLRIEREAAAAKAADVQAREAQRAAAIAQREQEKIAQATLRAQERAEAAAMKASAAQQREAERAAQAQMRAQERAEAATAKAAAAQQRAQERAAATAAKAAAVQKREAEKAAQAARHAQEKAAKESQAQWAKATSGINKLFKTVRRTIKATFLTAGLYAFFNAMKSMMQNAASQNCDFAAALASVKSNLATAFTPIMNAVLPALTALMQGLASATRAIASFIASIFGQTFAQAEAASKKLKAVASGAGGAAKAVEKANASLGIDELNVVDQNEDSGGGGGAGADVIADTGKEMTGLMDKLDAFWARFRELLAPSIEAWGAAWEQIKGKALECWPKIREAASGLWENGLAPLLNYLGTVFAPGIVNALSTAFAPIVGDIISTGIQLFTEGFTRACGLWTDAIQEVVLPALGLMLTVWTGLMDGIQSTWAAYGQPIMDGIVLAFQSVWNIIEGIWNTVLQPFFAWCIEAATELWNAHLKPLWDNIVGCIADIVLHLLAWWNNVLLPLLNWVVQTFGPFVEKVFELIGTVIKVVVGSIADSVNIWITLFRGLLQFFTAVFQGDWEGAWNAVQDTVQSVWDGIENTVKGTVNGIIDIVNSMVSAICAGINAIISAANNLSFDIPSWVPGIGGSHFGMSIPEVTAPQIPMLAQGGYIGPNQPQLAIIGDNRREGEIVAPESKIAEAVAAGLAAGGGAGAGNAELLDLLVQILDVILRIAGKDTSIQLDGEVIGRTVVRWMQNRGASVGGSFAEAY